MADRDKNILLMFSGGKDSLLAALKLNKEFPEHVVNLVTYDNGCMVGLKNVETSVGKLKEFDRYCYYNRGVFPIYGITRQFFFPYFNMKAEAVAEKYPGLTPSQFHCLICKTSMYIHSMWLAKKWNCEYVVNGARECQEFVVEHEEMTDRYQDLAKEFGLSIKYPVYDINDDWELENEILRYGLIPKVYEPKCLVGCPIYNTMDSQTIESTIDYYDKEIVPRIKSAGFLNPDIYEKFLTVNKN